MTYDDQKIKMGRHSIWVLEIDFKTCSLLFGVGLCTATETVPGSGTKCFNTFGTCPVPLIFKSDGRQTTTFRFSSERIDGLQQVGEPPVFPTILSMDNAPAKLEPGKGLGVRSSARITLQDHPWTDIGVDPYLSEGERTYTPDDQGTFWGKLLARDPFYENDIVRVKQGYLEDDGTYNEDNMETREYILFKISGPDKTGKVVIECKDVLKFADGVKAQVPRPSKAELDGALDNSATSFDITDVNAQIFDNFIAVPSQKFIIIDDEIIEIGAMIDNTGNSYSISGATRGKLPFYYPDPQTTEIDAHDDLALVQACFNFDNVRLDDILFTLLNTYAEIPAGSLDQAGWNNVMNFGLSNYNFSTLLIEPLSVKDLIEELSQYTVFFWWHERDAEVKMASLLELRLETQATLNDQISFLKNTVSVTRDVKQRNSQIWVYHGHRSPLEDLDKYQFFKSLSVFVNLDSETEDEYGKPAIRKIFSRWLTLGQTVIADEVASRLLDQYKDTKNIVLATLDAKDDDLWTGNLIKSQTQFVQDQFGADLLDSYLVLQVKEQNQPTGTKFQYLLQEWAQPIGRFAVIAPDTDPDNEPNPFPTFSNASDQQRNDFIFIAPDSGFFDDGSEAYQIW